MIETHITTRRDFLRVAAMVGAGVALMPKQALARITPPDEPDHAAMLQAQIDEAVASGGGTVVVKPGVYTLRRPLVLRGSVKMDKCFVTVTGRNALKIMPSAHRCVISNNVFVERPSLLTRLSRRFVA